MKETGYPLSRGMSNDDVSILQKKLLQLNYTISNNELIRSFFGKSTHDAVKRFQSEYNLDATGIANKTTTSVVDKALSVKKSGNNNINDKHKTNLTNRRKRNNNGGLMVPNAINADNKNSANTILQDSKLKDTAFLFKPEVLFGNLSNLSKLMAGNNKSNTKYIVTKLNERFHNEILNSVGTVSEKLAKELQSSVSKIDYEKYKDSDLFTAIEDILAELKKNKKERNDLLKEISGLELHINNSPAAKMKVSNVLNLDISLQENPIFYDDVQRAKIQEYAKFVNLGKESTKKLIDKNISFDSIDQTMLSDLVKEDIISENQKKELQLTVNLGKLTGDNLLLMKALKNKDLKSVTDFVGWDKSDWQELIKQEKIPLPINETIESYAENILFNIEKSYPSQFLLSRLVSSHLITAKVDLLDSLNGLLRNNNKLIDGKNSAVIDRRGTSAQRYEILQQNLQSITAFANTYRHLGIAEFINDKIMDLSQKKAAITSRIQLLDTFYNNNPDLELPMIDFFDKVDEILNWNGIPTSERSIVRKQLMAYQRTLNLAEDTVDKEILLSAGYDSATSIASKTEEEFVKTSGLELGKARLIYAKAQEYTIPVAHSFEMIRDVVRGQFKDLAVANIDPLLVNDLQKVDGFSDLFGSQDFCECDECKSILSPAAYFVDLMKFIERRVSNVVFANLPDHPLFLKNRRPDLWTLNLTCENTHTLIPYITIVNEVLEAYLNQQLSVGDIFEKMSQGSEKISFSVPYNQPMQELSIYLSHFGISLHELYKLLKQPEEKIWRARLVLSKEEFMIITTSDPATILFRFGNPSTINAIKRVQEFIRLVGISRSQLDELLAITFNPDLKNIIVTNEPIPDELQNFPEVLNGLTNDRLDFIHRFIRLWKKTSWSISELDLVLTALKDALLVGSQLDDKAVLYVAKLVDIQDKLKFTVEELCSLFYNLPSLYPKASTKQSDRKLFDRIFDTKKIFEDPVTHTINPFPEYYHHFFNTADPSDMKVDPKTGPLLAGLGISESELLLLFDLLKNEIPFNNSGKSNLNLERVSLLYRHARIARALKIKIDDFIKVLALIFSPGDSIVENLDQIFQLIEFKDWFKNSPFSISEVHFIVKGQENDLVRYAISSLEMVGKIIEEIQITHKDKGQSKLALLRDWLLKYFNMSSEKLTDTLKWINTDIASSGIQTALDTHFTNNVPDNPADLNTLFDLTREMEQIGVLFNNLKFKEETLKLLTNTPVLLGISDLKKITFSDLKALTKYNKIMTQGDENQELSLYSVLVKYQGAAAFSVSEVDTLATLWKQSQSVIDSLIKSLKFDTVPIEAISYLSRCLDICRLLGIDGLSLQKLADDSDFANLKLARDIALGAFGSKDDDEKVKKEKLEPYQDAINTMKRDALCKYIIALEKDLKFKDLHDIYTFFLLDVEMGGCFRTSRLVCAISSLQLYVHRCLVNLERSDPSLNPSLVNVSVSRENIPTEEWDWRKNYRVWEANRKVFLYPENYLYAALRDNKTPIFKELEDELLQEKITKESAESAYKKYLSQFAELSRLKIVGSYFQPPDQLYHSNSAITSLANVTTNTYYFFGRTQQDPPQFYYRKWIDNTIWTPWEKIDLAINAPYVSAILHLGKLYIFWVNLVTKEVPQITNGTTGLDYYDNESKLVFSYLNEKGKWIAPQKLDGLDPAVNDSGYDPYLLWNNENTQLDFELHKMTKKIFPQIIENSINLSYWSAFMPLVFRKINLFKNTLEGGTVLPLKPSRVVKLYYTKNSAKLGTEYWNGSSGFLNFESLFDAELELEDSVKTPHLHISDPFDYKQYNFGVPNPWGIVSEPVMQLVHNKYPESIFTFKDQQYLIQNIKKYINLDTFSIRELVRLTTTLMDRLGLKLFSTGLENFLSLETQRLTEIPFEIHITNKISILPPWDDPDHIDFKGSYGEYYRELFRDIPWLIGEHCNANQKFKDAKWWYERIFDPTTSEPVHNNQPTSDHNDNWKYIEFRDVTAQKMKDILTDKAAILQYEKNPFNPHAIARLRIGAYQKAVVMRYIDNLIDWADHLFAQDTMESINEATMLYVLAYDILGKRPVKLRKCETVGEENMNYNLIGPEVDKDSDFLVTLENWNQRNIMTTTINKHKIIEMQNSEISLSDTGTSNVSNQTDSIQTLPGTSASLLSETIGSNVLKLTNDVRYDYSEVITEMKSSKDIIEEKLRTRPVRISPAFDVVNQSKLFFCIPPNNVLLEYWDRVEDRLFKIRNCMNISGVRRQLALFQPPIDPMLLVRARAAGLSLEEIIPMPNMLPPYRFSYLIEKAKQFTQTVQNFGSALLNALEKKDLEELTLLRSVHERDILLKTTEIKKQQIREAEYQYLAMTEAKTNVQNTINYNRDLLDEGLTGWEITQQVSKHAAMDLKIGEGLNRIAASITYLIPQIGSLFALKYGGKEIGDSTKSWADWASTMASIADSVSATTGLEASFQRRAQQWEHELILAEQRLKEVEQQRLAADIRQQIARKDFEIHEKNKENVEELDDFYKNKFTKLGLFDYLSVALNRLYRDAYNMACDMAKMAEIAYKFERDDETVIFIAENNWQFDRAGLLAGERLLLQIQHMEAAYIKEHKRDFEITQSFSLSLLRPAELINLRENGNCEFVIPEIAFDLLYPGQYKRLIKSVRLTIPCLVGPYTNISAILTLEDSQVRRKPNTDDNDNLISWPYQKLTSIATSKAENDSGMFELYFRDERYLPFEGAGAVNSKWKLKLPSKLRYFDYNSISDVIVEICYTCKYDGNFRNAVEDSITDTLSTFATLEGGGLYRLISLKHEFQNAFHQLLHPLPPEAAQSTKFTLERKHFPYFLSDKTMNISSSKIYLKSKDKDDPIDTANLTLKIDGTASGNWSDLSSTVKDVKQAEIALSGSPLNEWLIDAGVNGLDKEKTDDILILMRYTV